MTRISLQKRQYALLGLALILLLAVLYRYSPGLAVFHGGADEIAAQQETLTKYRRLKEKKARLAKEAAQLDRELARAESFFLRGETPSLAAVDLQNTLKAITGDSGIGITSLQVIKPPRQKNDEVVFYQKIPVKISLELTVRQLKEVLYSITDSPLLLRVTEMDIKVDPRKEWLLKTEMTVTGLRVKDG